jgi:hypothetical protein
VTTGGNTLKSLDGVPGEKIVGALFRFASRSTNPTS